MAHQIDSTDAPSRPTDMMLAEKGQQIYARRMKQHAEILERAQSFDRVAAYAQINELRIEVERLRDWQESIADGTGHILRAEGQGGYEAADPETIIAAWRRLEREADTAADAYRRGAEAMREAAADLFQGNKPGLAAIPTWSAFIRALPIPEDKL